MLVEDIKCPICYSSTMKEIHKSTAIHLDYALNSNELISREISYILCENCGFIGSFPRVSKKDLSGYYTKVPTFLYEDEMEGYKKNAYEASYKFLQSNVDVSNKRVLEVGPATGTFLRILEEREKAIVSGIEPSQVCCDIARQKYGYNFIRGSLEDINLKRKYLNGAFFLTICQQVLEHVGDPREFFGLLANTVAPKGYLIVEVPSNERMCQIPFGVYGNNVNVVHLNYFLGSNLVLLGEQYGLIPVSMSNDTDGEYPTCRVLFHKSLITDYAAECFNKQVNQIDFHDRQALTMIKNILSKGRKVVIWGIGVDFIRIMKLETSLFINENITLVDRNRDKQSKTLFGKLVSSPDKIRITDDTTVLMTPSNSFMRASIKKDVEKTVGSCKCESVYA
ncbi:MAG: class I SAM-dependent methyltransferase [Candidatus Bathyarchaeota archaeon]|nr:class I SAM-dependent methyltransferase [Candidatus Bathyarchaeota archaeon]